MTECAITNHLTVSHAPSDKSSAVEFTQRDSDNNMISNNPLSIVALHLNDVPSILTVDPMDAADWPVVAH